MSLNNDINRFKNEIKIINFELNNEYKENLLKQSKQAINNNNKSNQFLINESNKNNGNDGLFALEKTIIFDMEKSILENKSFLLIELGVEFDNFLFNNNSLMIYIDDEIYWMENIFNKYFSVNTIRQKYSSCDKYYNEEDLDLLHHPQQKHIRIIRRISKLLPKDSLTNRELKIKFKIQNNSNNSDYSRDSGNEYQDFSKSYMQQCLTVFSKNIFGFSILNISLK